MNLNHFLTQSDAVGLTLFGLLLGMSMASWYFIVVKAWQVRVARHHSSQFLNRFWNAASLDDVAQSLRQHPSNEPFAHLTYHAITAARHHAAHGAHRLHEAGSATEFLTRAMRRIIDEETARLEWGLTALASIASTAPFVGLFGTVWGVYHALIGIGKSGLTTSLKPNSLTGWKKITSVEATVSGAHAQGSFGNQVSHRRIISAMAVHLIRPRKVSQ